LLVALFIWGAIVSTTVAIVASLVGQGVLVAATGLDAADSTYDAISSVAIAPVTEECAKGFGLLLLWGASAFWLKEVDGPLDGAIYGGVVGLGFTLTEDILYVAGAMAEGGPGQFAALFVLRTILSGLGHASFTALTGLGIGVAVESRSTVVKVVAPLAGLAGAIALHAFHNALVTLWLADGAGLVLKLLVFWGIDGLYFMLLVLLVARDRRIVVEELRDEVGRLIRPHELTRTASGWMFVPLWNYFSLMDSPGGYFAARAKQLALVELAFAKHRLRRAEGGIEQKGRRLVATIEEATRRGVLVGRF
jgi:RsiW-degrading membrane proteinase PrsW (M82 family)